MSPEHNGVEDVLGALELTVKRGPAWMEFQLLSGDLLMSEAAASAPLLHRPMLRFIDRRVKRMRVPELPASAGVVDFEAHRGMWGRPGLPDQATLIVENRRGRDRSARR